MTRISKKAQIKAVCPRKLKASHAEKTGPKKDALPKGFREHVNALDNKQVFIPKVK